MKQIITAFLLFATPFFSLAQEIQPAWDNTVDKKWPELFVPVEIKSSADGKIQNAVFYKSTLSQPQPLIVSLHSWSSDYLQEDQLSGEILLRGWNYIHPDFRGRNNNPEACGSSRVISDIEDAIQFAIQNANVDKSEVHIIGSSGGGYATLLSFMQIRYPVKSFSAWVPISNLEDWYWETKARDLQYAHDLEGVTTNGNGFDPEEARRRSPVLMDFPSERRKNASLHIYTGIHDGYTGSVPITHSINMYNRLLPEMYPGHAGQLVSDSLKLLLLGKRMNPAPDTNLVLGGRKVHLHRGFPQLSLTVFEGRHEMIVPQALSLIPVYGKRNFQDFHILTIGDSNGAAPDGWPAQLEKLLPFSTVINCSVSGNTIGFDNLGNPKLNTLRNIQAYLDSALTKIQPAQKIDMIIFGLGTNDAKQVFDPKQDEVAENLDSLLSATIQFFQKNNLEVPQIVLLTPPPMNEKLADPVKYGGGNQRIQKNLSRFQAIAQKYQVPLIDIFSFYTSAPGEKTRDGIHLTAEAQFQMAEFIVNSLNDM